MKKESKTSSATTETDSEDSRKNQKDSGSNSLTHSGISGFAVQVQGDRVIKWTKGPVSSVLLKESCFKQIDDFHDPHMNSVEAVPVASFDFHKDTFSFQMPLIKLPSVFKFSGDFTRVNDMILSRFQVPPVYERGFGSIVMAEIEALVEEYPFIEQYSDHIVPLLKNDSYRYGYAHGDFGPANLFVDSLCLKAVDYSHAFIDSPLLDLAMFDLSVSTSSYSHGEHYRILRNIRGLFKQAELDQVEIIKAVKILSWMPHADGPHFRRLLRMLGHD